MEVVVFTNGVFDLIHPGHIDLLERARALGTRLVVGINSDESVRKIRGADRPFVRENDRAAILMGLAAVDQVRIFNEPTPQKLIEEIKPDVLVKGGDWSEDEIVGADFVKKNGGKVFSLPLKDGFSSTAIIEKIRNVSASDAESSAETGGSLAEMSLRQHLVVFQTMLASQLGDIEHSAEMIFETVARGNKILLCGNGGSAADAQHLAAEFVGRYEAERIALPAIALTTDTSALTALSNDYGFERIFARQIEALAREGDLLIAISTSGNSPNVISAVMTARKIGCKVIGLTGAAGKKLASLCDACILIPATRTARIQEAHIAVGHIWCELIDKKIESKQ
jgi:D-sedoheptulose 7-phosphate isomerase